MFSSVYKSINSSRADGKVLKESQLLNRMILFLKLNKPSWEIDSKTQTEEASLKMLL